MRKIAFWVIGLFIAVTAAYAVADEAASLPKDLQGYKHIGSLVIPDRKSPLFGIHHFYMNKKGLEAFEKGKPYPAGTVIVGAVYEAATNAEGAINEGKKLFHTFMKKDPKGKDTGGWIFAAFATDGRKIEKDVKADCFICHSAVKESDYVFSKPLK